MRLALLGYPIKHSRSPELYRKLLKGELESYDLLSYQAASDIPSLSELAQRFDGLSITSPYKRHFLSEVSIESDLVRNIGAINTISFSAGNFWATNTDVVAVELILKNFLLRYPSLHLIILGSGVMANMTKLVADKLSISSTQLSRRSHPDLARLDLKPFDLKAHQNIIINACSRDFIFEGQLSSSDIFWDYNYSFDPHEDTIPQRVMAYHDGQEMLRLQAEAAIEFWRKNKS